MALFSESVNFTLSDIHMVFGPRTDTISQDEDFSEDLKNCYYDLEDQISNIALMHEVCDEKRKIEKIALKQRLEERKLRRKQERAKEREELNRKYQEELKKKSKNPAKWERERQEKMQE